MIPSQCQCFIEEQLGEAEPDFAYVAGLQSDDPEDWIWLFDAPVNHNGRGGIILYLSGETGHFGPEAFEAELQRFRGQYERERSRPPRIVLPG